MSAPSFNDPEMQEIFEGFVIETQELLDNLSQDLMILEDNPDDFDLLNRIFRSAHTIKGTSSFMGFEDITKVTHAGEEILNKLRKGELKVSLPIIDVLLEVHDIIEKLMTNLVEGIDEEVDYSETLKKIQILKEGGEIDESATESTESSEQEIKEDEKTQVTSETDTENAVEKILSGEAISQGKGDFSEDEEALIQQAFSEINKSFAEELPDETEKKADGKTEIQKEEPKTEEIKKEEKLQPEEKETSVKKTRLTESAKGQKPKKSTETIRVDVTRVESLMDLSGELVLGRNRLSQITSTIEKYFDNKDLLIALNETSETIDFITSEIQTAVMRMRMVPVGKLYQKAPRIVRDLSKEFKKKIKLVVIGEETEIDRGIIEELNDPLTHMIRNSCDHGIETTEERIRLGKPEQGTITLDAEQEGNNIVLKISDDGKGMDPEKLKETAIKKGLITEEQASQMSKREALQLIFKPGFSTAAKVTSVSGRGVGMDVVRSNIQHLKGMVEIESEIGIGSTFIIKLPLTLAIIQGLLVKLRNETYAIPLSSVEEVVAIDLDTVSTVNMQEVIRIRDNVLPLVRLGNILGTTNENEDLKDKYVVVVGLGVHRAGLIVDELLGQQEIVIKSIGEYLGHVKGIAGSTILGDGRVIMIIDIAELVQESHKNDFIS